MGVDADAPTAAVYGNFKCPYTREFVFGNLEPIVEEFVVTGRLNLEFRNLAYEPGSNSTYYISDSDPRIATVGLAVWDEDPESYWQFHHDTFADAPSGYVDYDELASRASSAGVSNVDPLVDRAADGEYDANVEQIPLAAGDDGISFTPQMEFAEETAAPHHGTQSILDWIEAHLEDAPAETDGDEEPAGGSDESDEDADDGEPDEDGSGEEPAESENESADEDDSDEESEDSEDESTSEDDATNEAESEESNAETPEETESDGEDEGSADEADEEESEPQSDEMESDGLGEGSADESVETNDTNEPSGDESAESDDETDDDCPYR